LTSADIIRQIDAWLERFDAAQEDYKNVMSMLYAELKAILCQKAGQSETINTTKKAIGQATEKQP